ncbi:MAG TPA: baseplate J/gp47 family protein [Blastocatellia bacterium]|nr:baseplate J/gp47 family protein [Blastocatellia bacterium]
MATINVRDKRQVIDYLARDYNSFRQALIDLIPAKLPEWTDRSESSFGIVLIELFAYMADILSYYQDRLANEAFLTTAQERRSVINHLRLIGYELAPAAPAAARLSLVVANNVTRQLEVRRGDQFSTPGSKQRPSVTFEYTGERPLVIDLSTSRTVPARKPDGSVLPGFKEVSGVIPVREGRSIVAEVLGVSDGSPNQRFTLAQQRVLPDTLEVVVETNPPTPAWRKRKSLIFSRRAFTPEQLAALEHQERIGSTLAFSRSADRDYATEIDENDVTTVIFGDGQYGLIPPSGSRVLASYRVGGGQIGNVGAGQITVIAKAPQLQLLGAKVVNREPASGGAERESIEQAINFAPTVFTSMQRAVTAGDYVAQAKLFPGVSKARAEATNWNTIKLFIAPAGSGEPPSDILKRDLLAYFEDKRMLTSFIQIESPDYVRIAVAADIIAAPFFQNEDVRGTAEKAIRDLFDFEAVDFKQSLYLSKIYEALERLDGVDSVFVRRFNIAESGAANETVPLDEDIAPNGLIQMGENQITVLGDLAVVVTGGV